MLPRDPVTAELIESRWLVGQLAGLGGAATVRVDGVSRAMAPWSPALARLHRVPTDAAAATVAEYCARVVHPRDRSGVQRNANFALDHPESGFDLECSIVSAATNVPRLAVDLATRVTARLNVPCAGPARGEATGEP